MEDYQDIYEYLKDLRDKLLKSVDEKGIIELAKDLIRIPSYTGEESEKAKFLAKFMQERGIGVELQEVEKGRLQVIGRIKGTGEGLSLMFNGHIDTDVVSIGWKRDPWTATIEGNRMYGIGILNMLAGDIAMVMAADALKRAGIELKGDLIIALVVGELQGGVGTKHLLDMGVTADMAVVPEPSALNILTTNAGVMQLEINAIGQTVHISRMEREGINALDKMLKVIGALKEMKFTFQPDPRLPGLPRMNIGSIIGGRGREHELRMANMVPDFCTIIVDVRYLPSQTPEGVEKDIVRVLEELKRNDPNLRYEVKCPPSPKFKANKVIMPPMDVPTDEHIVQTLRRNHKYVTGEEVREIGAVYPMMYGCSDASHLYKAGIPSAWYGPGGGYGRTVMEKGTHRLTDQYEADYFCFIDEMITCTKVLALTALDVCTKGKNQ